VNVPALLDDGAVSVKGVSPIRVVVPLNVPIVGAIELTASVAVVVALV
jgi:hypothetical protein